MGATVKNESKARIRVHFGDGDKKDKHGDSAELNPGEQSHCKSGAFAIDETWTIRLDIYNEDYLKWFEGPTHQLTGIAATNSDRHWNPTDGDIEPFLPKVREDRTELFKNDNDVGVTELYNVENNTSTTVENESIEKIMKDNSSKYDISLDGSGKVKDIEVKGKAEGQWTNEEKDEMETIRKEINEMANNYSGSITVPPGYCLFKVKYYTLFPGNTKEDISYGYAIEPIK